MTQQDRNVARAAELDCASLSDALDRLSIAGQCYRIKPCDPSFRMTGRAFTVQYEPATTGDGNVGEFIDDVEPGSVIVIDNRGRDDVGTWGNILTEMAHRRGMAGTLIDGNCRDVALSRSIGYPIFSRDWWMRTGKGRIQLKALQAPVTIGGVVVNPGDIVRGDADGVVVLPRSHEDALLEVAEDITRKESAIRDAIRAGQRLDQARVRHQYHALQSPDYQEAGKQ
ncbi:dimethylmenaquinone methyltransferase [Bordetella ansorpii]|uniref:Putative 4-hydroxy-4-methyl-2-oxoglutarate aldolase n=1 Tax=Bordetella ansorpii TaxID=288768 RepID=A0A157SW02_9BORD|nr:RraA family protein [Bordetella ansorpii]SAI74253.1 dimethylmenaquinone methyltransferase [Bordetella ansorpii]